MSAIDIGIVRYLFPQPLCGSLSIPFRGLVNHLQYVGIREGRRWRRRQRINTSQTHLP